MPACRWLGIISDPLPMLYNEGSVILGMIHFLLPYMILNIYVSLEGIDRNLLSAARTLGCTAFQSFREVTLPLSLPGLGAGSLLCFVLAAGSYVTPAILGNPRDYFFGNLIYDATMTELNWPMGATLSMVLLHPAGGHRGDLQPLHGPQPHLQGAEPMSDGVIGWRAINFASVLVYLFLFAPIMVTMLLSFNASQFGGFPMTGFSFHWFGVLMHNDIVLAAVRRSLILGSLTAIDLARSSASSRRSPWCATSSPARNSSTR